MLCVHIDVLKDMTGKIVKEAFHDIFFCYNVIPSLKKYLELSFIWACLCDLKMF